MPQCQKTTLSSPSDIIIADIFTVSHLVLSFLQHFIDTVLGSPVYCLNSSFCEALLVRYFNIKDNHQTF